MIPSRESLNIRPLYAGVNRLKEGMAAVGESCGGIKPSWVALSTWLNN